MATTNNDRYIQIQCSRTLPLISRNLGFSILFNVVLSGSPFRPYSLCPWALMGELPPHPAHSFSRPLLWGCLDALLLWFTPRCPQGSGRFIAGSLSAGRVWLLGMPPGRLCLLPGSCPSGSSLTSMA